MSVGVSVFLMLLGVVLLVGVFSESLAVFLILLGILALIGMVSHFRGKWLLWVSAVFFMHGILVLSDQVGYWLKQGEWMPLSVLYLFIPFKWSHPLIPSLFVGSWRWLESPSSWYGVHKMIYSTLEAFSIPSVSLILALVFFVTALSGGQGPGLSAMRSGRGW